jgi:glycosyltransferase involved in cell wall biosynthesis
MQATLSTSFQRDAARRRHFWIVTETYPPEVNGVALTLAQLVEGLRAQGHTVSVVRPRQRGDPAGPAGHPDVTLVRGLPLPGYGGLQFGLPAGRALCRRWARHRPDAVYVATEGPLGWSAVRSARSLGIPVFSGFHTNFHSYSGHYHAGWLRSLIFRYLCSFHNRTNGTLVAVADVRDRLQATGFRNVSVVGRGVDSRLFTPDRRSPALRRMWGAAEDDLVALYVGRIAPEKNLGLAIEAYRAMRRTGRAVKFVLVGDGPLRAALQARHSELIFSGEQTGERLAGHYASGDVFLFPSETETFGNVTLEAMSSGLVVVAYDYAAARTHIRNAKTGVLVPCGEPEAFVEAAAGLSREPRCLAGIRRRARQHAATLDWQRVVERFAALLTEAPAGAAPRAQES